MRPDRFSRSAEQTLHFDCALVQAFLSNPPPHIPAIFVNERNILGRSSDLWLRGRYAPPLLNAYSDIT